jgi:hypothetical protein
MTTWLQLDPNLTHADLGFLWDILIPEDPRPVREQLDDRYAHGGGFRPFGEKKKWKLNRATLVLRYPGDPPFWPAAMLDFKNEIVIFYSQCSLLLILQKKDGTWELTRVD